MGYSLQDLIAIQAETGAEFVNEYLCQSTGISFFNSRLFYNNKLIRITANPEIISRFLSPYIDIVNYKLHPLKKRVIAYKATDKIGHQVPGFMALDIEYAKVWLNNDCGGPVLVSGIIEPSTKFLDRASILNGRDEDIVILPGAPQIIDLKMAK